MRLLLVLNFVFLFSFIALASAISINNPNLPLVKNEPTIITFNNNTGGVNSSDFWDLLDTPLDFTNIITTNLITQNATINDTIFIKNLIGEKVAGSITYLGLTEDADGLTTGNWLTSMSGDYLTFSSAVSVLQQIQMNLNPKDSLIKLFVNEAPGVTNSLIISSTNATFKEDIVGDKDLVLLSDTGNLVLGASNDVSNGFNGSDYVDKVNVASPNKYIQGFAKVIMDSPLWVGGNIVLTNANGKYCFEGGTSDCISHNDAFNQINFQIGGFSRVFITSTQTVFNSLSTKADTIIKGDTDGNLLYADGGNDAVTIGGNLNNGKFNVVGNSYLNGNLEVVDNLTIGDRASFGGQGMPNVSGSVNLTTLYYDTLSANSPHFFEADSEAGYTRFCIKDVNGFYNMFWWDGGVIQVDSNNLRCNLKISKVQNKREQYPLWIKDKSLCEDLQHSYSRFDDYLGGKKVCLFDSIKAKRNCEVNPWSYFENGVCKENTIRKCQYGETTSWDFDNSVCKIDLEKLCLSSVNMSWVDGKCVLDERKVLQNQKEECLRDNSKYWNSRDNVCVSLRVIGGG